MAAQALKWSAQKGRLNLGCRCGNMVVHARWTAVATPAILPERVIRRKSQVTGQKKEEEEDSQDDTEKTRAP